MGRGICRDLHNLSWKQQNCIKVELFSRKIMAKRFIILVFIIHIPCLSFTSILCNCYLKRHIFTDKIVSLTYEDELYFNNGSQGFCYSLTDNNLLLWFLKYTCEYLTVDFIRLFKKSPRFMILPWKQQTEWIFKLLIILQRFRMIINYITN